MSLLSPASAATTRPALELTDAENRLVFVGNGFLEQSRAYGYIEARLLRWCPERIVTIRNLGWSGDSVSGAARTPGYQEPAGLERLTKDASELKPSMIFVGYGMIESFDGEAGIAGFDQGYRKLLDALQRMTPKLVLISPTIHEDVGGQREEAAKHDRDLERYAAVIAKIAAERKLPFVDLYHPLRAFARSHPGVRLTSNGISLNDVGYWVVAAEIERQLGLVEEPGWSATVTPGKGGSELQLVRKRLPPPEAPGDVLRKSDMGDDATLVKVASLGAGIWSLDLDGHEVASADAAGWSRGVVITDDPDRAVMERLRQEVVHSGELFYRRSRPFNDHSRHWTYISGDYAMYDEQLAELDRTIVSLRRPAGHEWKLVRKESPKP